MTLPNLLYVSPIAPNSTGGGTAMRAYHNLAALASHYSVYLLVVDVGTGSPPPGPDVPAICKGFARLPFDPLRDLAVRIRLEFHKVLSRFLRKRPSEPLLWRFATRRRRGFAGRAFPSVDFQAVHVFRLTSLPYGRPFLARPSVRVRQLDLDDIESLACKRLSVLYGRNGKMGIARQMAFDAELYENIERRALPEFDRVFLCSDKDRDLVAGQYHCREVRVLPNIVQVPGEARPARSPSAFNFLLVGSFGHYPNLDGLIYFCEEIVPFIRKEAPAGFLFTVVGGGIPGKYIRKLSGIPEVRFAGRVDDLSPFYAAASAAVIPLRAGGGTRIKILEAFAHRTPVISTTIGAEGLGVRDGEHLLCADTPEQFARACCVIMSDKDLGDRLTANAYTLLREKYNPEIVRRQLCG